MPVQQPPYEMLCAALRRQEQVSAMAQQVPTIWMQHTGMNMSSIKAIWVALEECLRPLSTRTPDTSLPTKFTSGLGFVARG